MEANPNAGPGFHAAADGFSEGMRSTFLNFLNTYGMALGIYKQAEKEATMGPEDPALEASELPAYVFQLENMVATDCYTLFVNWDDIFEWDPEFANSILENHLRAEPALRRAVQNFAQQHDPELAKETHDSQRRDREFFVSIFGPGLKKHHMRDLWVEKIGHLTCFQGTVTRTSEVRPELYLGAFRCGECSTVVRGVEQQFKYSPPMICSNATCGNRKFWTLVREDSVFVDWQKIKVQENNEEVPAGCLPRTMDVVLRHNMVETVKAGDKVRLTGSVVVVPDVAVLSAPGERVSVKSGGQRNAATSAEGVTGLKSLGTRELSYKLMFIATNTAAASQHEGMVNIRSEVDETPEEVLAGFSNQLDVEEVLTMSQNPLIYQRLAKSICPSVYGHDSIKQAVLLMMLGGVHKTTPEGISLRGDINVAIVGDPSCAKSQILKYVAGFLPRAVYTSGKASTAAGLTASVVKEPDTNEFAIEAGALMLANNGICCIDEFDKMDVKDQVAIHEAMEQQTISISKAGVQATLNARTSILAAANPVGGRYDKSKPLKYNVSLPPAILSRFDLLHVMCDDTTEEVDQRIAEFILRVHKMQARAWSVPYTQETMQRYIKYARAHRPTISPEAHDALVKAYRDLRCEDAAPGTNTAYRITVRQLEAMVRLSEAIARMHCKLSITPAHVAEAKRLLKTSVLKIEQADVELDDLVPLRGFDLEDIADLHNHSAQDAGEATDEGPGVNNENNASAANRATPAGSSKRGADGSPSGASREAKRVRTAAEMTPEVRTAVPEAAQPAKGSGPGARTKVTAAKYAYVKNLLVKRLLDEEAAVRARLEQQPGGGAGGLPSAGASTPLADAATSADVQGEAYRSNNDMEAAAEHNVPIGASAGLQQMELLRWYNNKQLERGKLLDTEAQLEEMALVSRIINHLIRKDSVLAVLSRPEREPEEEEDDYLQRVQAERVLCLHANYAPDV